MPVVGVAQQSTADKLAILVQIDDDAGRPGRGVVTNPDLVYRHLSGADDGGAAVGVGGGAGRGGHGTADPGGGDSAGTGGGGDIAVSVGLDLFHSIADADRDAGDHDALVVGQGEQVT